MNFNKNKWSKVLAMFLAVVMTIMAMPMSAFAAVASDLPDNMADHSILRALEYTGYDVQKQKNDGTLYQSGSYGSRTPAAVLSGINYGTSTSGKETVADSSTVTGRAPDIATFQSKGLCCASFVTYYICNYLPNIEGVASKVSENTLKNITSKVLSFGKTVFLRVKSSGLTLALYGLWRIRKSTFK